MALRVVVVVVVWVRYRDATVEGSTQRHIVSLQLTDGEIGSTLPFW